ncbi:MAG: DUF523 domain-containing protein [Bacillota bacterium]
MKLLVSACLLGINCKYNGENNSNEKLISFLENHEVIPVCPEQLGGLTTPRLPAEITSCDGEAVLKGNARVADKSGRDVTREFLAGADETLKIARLCKCEAAIMKARSPSCGCGEIYDGSHSKNVKSGNGVCTQLLLNNGIKVYTDENYEELQ